MSEGWRDIGSAPKDGTRVLLVPKFKWEPVAIAYWIGAPHNHWSIDGFKTVDAPRFWQPLPLPPA